MNNPSTTRKRGAVHSIREEMRGVLIFIAVIWVVFLVSQFVPQIRSWGLIPRNPSGLIGILTMTFLHANWQHIASNTIPLLILLALLAGSKVSSLRVVPLIVLLGGALLWIIGMPGNHIGASLLIFGLITFLIAAGLFFEKRPIPMVYRAARGIPLRIAAAARSAAADIESSTRFLGWSSLWRNRRRRHGLCARDS